LAVLLLMMFDSLVRLFHICFLEVWKTINDDVSKKILISRNTYDGTGQLLTKELGRKKVDAGVYTNVPLETLNYSYNIRGWLKGINKDYANNTGSGQTASWFGMELDYDWGFENNQLNGNIAGTKWRSRGDNMQRSYGFTYDNANRIMSSDFNQLNSAWDKSAGINFSSVMGDGVDPFSAYDENGSILAMKQWGLKGTSSTIIDDLAYTYNDKSNKLKNVIDGVNDPNTKLGDFRASTRYISSYGIKDINSVDYLYDQNGNMIQDLNKGLEIINAPDVPIGAIIYNHLNLPSSINISNDQGNGNQKGNIYYLYDATGSKLEKRVHENPATANNNTEKNTTTTYLGEFVYENDELKFFSHEEGRVRWVQKLPENPGSWAYDFFIRDHLGNVRMVLTDEQQKDMYPAATMETATTDLEEVIYTNLNTTRIDKPAGYPTDTYTNPNDKVARLKGTATKVGPAILLKVMSGDTFNFQVSSWYKLNGAQPGSSSNPVNDLVLSLANGISPLSGGKVTALDLQSPAVLNPQVMDFLSNQSNISTRPKAGVNWILLDEQFKMVASNSGYEQVPDESVYGNGGANPAVYWHRKTDMPVTKNGYLYIYVSNESDDAEVFFDNLQVSHIRGPLLDETHYYPFGMVMAGISSKAARTLENKYKFNKGSELQNKEFSDGNGLDLYTTQFRSLDPQLGRWWQIDPKLDMAQSPYSSMGNNPIRYNDPLGDTLPMPYSELAANYPTSGSPKEMYSSVGGKVAEAYNKNESKGDANPYANTCALRMSVALNKSGNDLDTDVKNSKGQKMFTLEGGDGKDYALRKSDVKDYMGGKYGKSDISTKIGDKDFDQKINDIKGQKGVVVFDVSGWSNATGHVTIYDGKGNCGHDCYFPDVIKKENATREAWNASHPNENPIEMIKLTGVSLWIAK
jgi:RHS repeat-associated protein